jgi:hypothetical protein
MCAATASGGPIASFSSRLAPDDYAMTGRSELEVRAEWTRAMAFA